jgi:branched-chain amino acid transport system substrate-binding protein
MFAAAMLPFVQFPGGTAMAQEALRIGMLAPTSGPLAKLGQETVIGSEIAAELINEAGGVKGRKLELVIADTPTPDQAKSAVERLVNRDQIRILTGNYGSSLAIAASTAAVRNGAFYWEQSSASYDITRKAPPYSVKSTWGNFELTNRLVDVLENVLAPRLGKPVSELRIAFLHEDSSWGSELAEFIAAATKAKNLKVVFAQGYNAARTSDFTPMILRLKQEQPDVVMAASYLNDAIKFQQQVRDQNLQMKAMIGFTAGYGIADFAESLGPAANDILVIDSNPRVSSRALTPEANQVTEEFTRRFEKRTGKPPASHAIYAFMGTYALGRYVLPAAASLEAAEIFKQAMALDMPFGSLPMGFGLHFTPPDSERPRYNERGLTVLNQWRDGKFVTVYPAEYATDELRNIPLQARAGQ